VLFVILLGEPSERVPVPTALRNQMKGIVKKYKGPQLNNVLRKTRHNRIKCEAQKHALTICRKMLNWNPDVRLWFRGRFEDYVIQEEQRRVKKREARKVKRQRRC